MSTSPPRALIVAPTHLKFVQTTASKIEDSRESHENDTDSNGTSWHDAGYLDHSETLSNVWSSMETEMKSAKALVFIGYSFPIADLYFSSVLRSVLVDRGGAPGIVIVNPDARAIRDRLRLRFPLAKVSLYYDLSTFSQAKRKDILDAVL